MFRHPHAGMCVQVAPVRFKKVEYPSEGVRSGVLECPEPTVAQWFTFHYACTKSGNTSTAGSNPFENSLLSPYK